MILAEAFFCGGVPQSGVGTLGSPYVNGFVLSEQ